MNSCTCCTANHVSVLQVGLETAGQHLAERYGTMFQTVWALGLLASGQVSTIGLTHAGQQIMMGMLNLEVRHGNGLSSHVASVVKAMQVVGRTVTSCAQLTEHCWQH